MPWKSGVLAKLCWDTDAVHVTALPWACSQVLENQDTTLLLRHTVILLSSCRTLLLSLSTLGFNTLGTAGQAPDLPANCLSWGLEQRQKCWAAQWDLLALWQGNERWEPKDYCHAQNTGLHSHWQWEQTEIAFLFASLVVTEVTPEDFELWSLGKSLRKETSLWFFSFHGQK